MQGHLEELKRGGRPMTKTEIKLNKLNKGIDELLNKYENILHHLEKSQTQRFNHTYQIKIDLIKEYKEDLKKLKGEIE